MFWREKIDPKNSSRLFILYFLGLLLAISSALPAYIQSNFIGQFVNIKIVGLFFVIANIVSAISIWFFPALIKKLTNYFLTKVILVVYGASLLGLTMASSAIQALISITLFIVTSNLLWINMDVLVESFSANGTTGKIRTIYFTFINAGWILSPLLASYLINKGEYSLSFFIAALLVIPVFIIFLYQGRRLKDCVIYKKSPLTKVLKGMWRNKNLRGIFFIALLLQLFYSAAVVYIPLYLYQNLGMSWQVLGIIFSIMLIPFIIIEIPAGIIADKYLGEKEMLIVGLSILSVSLFLFFYVSAPIAWLWALILFFSRCGAALVESMRETYFFKLVNAKDLGLINIFRITGPLGYVIGSGLAILLASYFPLNHLFLIMAIIMLSGLGFAISLKDTK